MRDTTKNSDSKDYVCNLDVGGWQLYSYEWGDGNSNNRARVKRRAQSLSKELTKLVRSSRLQLRENPRLDKLKMAAEIRDKMYALMAKYSNDGATDTEPECALVAEIERALGLDQLSLDR